MLEEGIIRLAVRGLTGSSEKEREYAVRLLLDFSSDEDICVKIASGRGALVLLSSMADNLENPSLSHLAEEVLKRVEKVEQNVEHLAVAGRFEPLLKRLREGKSSSVQNSSNELTRIFGQELWLLNYVTQISEMFWLKSVVRLVKILKLKFCLDVQIPTNCDH